MENKPYKDFSRSQVAQGRARDAMGGYAPRAADMLKLVGFYPLHNSVFSAFYYSLEWAKIGQIKKLDSKISG